MSNEGFFKWICGFHKTYTKRGGKFSKLEGTRVHPKCPSCGIPMLCMGKTFEVPPKKDKKRWARLKELHVKQNSIDTMKG